MSVTDIRSTNSAHALPSRAVRSAARRRVVVLEPDALTQWALKTYLTKWFGVDSTDSTEDAQRLLDAQDVVALVISDELPPAEMCRVEQYGLRKNADLHIIQTVTDPSRVHCDRAHVDQVEKPFALARVAQLLGVPEAEIPAES